MDYLLPFESPVLKKAEMVQVTLRQDNNQGGVAQSACKACRSDRCFLKDLARYMKVVAKNVKEIPAWHPFAGNLNL